MEDTVGIDVLDALGHGGGFLQPKGGVKGFRLAIQVGESHLVVVHQGQLADPSPRQSLGAPASHAADAKNGHMGLAEPLHGRGAQQHFCAEKLFMIHGDAS